MSLSRPHGQAVVVVEDKERLLMELQKKVVSLERRLQGNLSQDEHLQELLQEVTRENSTHMSRGTQTCGLKPGESKGPEVVLFYFKPVRNPAWRRLWRRAEPTFWFFEQTMQTLWALWRHRWNTHCLINAVTSSGFILTLTLWTIDGFKAPSLVREASHTINCNIK